MQKITTLMVDRDTRARLGRLADGKPIARFLRELSLSMETAGLPLLNDRLKDINDALASVSKIMKSWENTPPITAKTLEEAIELMTPVKKTFDGITIVEEAPDSVQITGPLSKEDLEESERLWKNTRPPGKDRRKK